jgi:hypothetical protein
MWVVKITSDRLGGIIHIHSFGDGRVNDEFLENNMVMLDAIVLEVFIAAICCKKYHVRK